MNEFEEVLAQHRINNEAISAACKRAQQVGCGIRVLRHQNGTVTVTIDPFVAALKIIVDDE